MLLYINKLIIKTKAMSANTHKYHVQGSVAYPHAGNIIEKHLSKYFSNISKFAHQFGVKPTTIRQYFISDSLQMGILWKLSLATNHNFLLEIGSKLPIDYATPAVVKLQEELDVKQQELNSKQAEIEALQKKIELMQVELSVYKSIVVK